MADITALPALIRKRLAFFSLTACGINANITTTTIGSRFSYQFYNGDPQHHLIDPSGMLSANGYEITIPSSGNYEFHIQYGASMYSLLQEMYVTRNWVNNGAVPTNSNVNNDIIMFLNFPANGGVSSPHLPISAFAIAHCEAGDVIRLLEGGNSTTNLPEGIKFMIKQLDEEPTA